MAVASHGVSMSARLAWSAAVLLLAGCAASDSAAGRRARNEPPAPAAGGDALDPSYDWHGLLPAPFGTLLKETPLPLHEVLLFHDAAHDAADADGRDCHAIAGAAPRFVGLEPDQYLLCFDHDRLSRIEASVRLNGDEAARVFARACALWLKGTVPASGIGTTCEGGDRGIAFSARLGLVPGEAATLNMTLSGAAVPQ